MMMGAAPPSLFGLVDSDFDTANDDEYSFTINLGAADPSRWILVSITWAGGFSLTLSDVELGGVPAAYMGQNTSASGGLGFAIFPYPTGTSALLEITLSGNANNCTVFVYREAKPNYYPSASVGRWSTTNSALLGNNWFPVNSDVVVMAHGFGTVDQNTILLSWSGSGSFSLDGEMVTETSSRHRVWSEEFASAADGTMITTTTAGSGANGSRYFSFSEIDFDDIVVPTCFNGTDANVGSRSILAGFGPNHADRMVIGIGMWSAGTTLTLSAFDINGSAATQRAINNGSSGAVMIYTQDVASGGAGPITFSAATMTASVIAGLVAIPDDSTPVDSGSGTANSTNLAINDIEIVEDGFVVIAATSQADEAMTLTFSGTDNPVLLFQFTMESTRYGLWIMKTTENLATGDFDLSSASSVIKRMAIASWGPQA